VALSVIAGFLVNGSCFAHCHYTVTVSCSRGVLPCRQHTVINCLTVQVTHLSCDHGADQMLDEEARKWSARVVCDMRTIRTTAKQINRLMEQIQAAKVFLAARLCANTVLLLTLLKYLCSYKPGVSVH